MTPGIHHLCWCADRVAAHIVRSGGARVAHGPEREDRLIECPTQTRRGTSGVVRKVWTAEELGRLTPAEQDALFDASIVTDVDQVPALFLERVLSRAEKHLVPGDTPPR
jgi:hypothetical protein